MLGELGHQCQVENPEWNKVRDVLKEASIQKVLGEECSKKKRGKGQRHNTHKKKEGKVKEKYMMFHPNA